VPTVTTSLPLHSATQAQHVISRAPVPRCDVAEVASGRGRGHVIPSVRELLVLLATGRGAPRSQGATGWLLEHPEGSLLMDSIVVRAHRLARELAVHQPAVRGAPGPAASCTGSSSATLGAPQGQKALGAQHMRAKQTAPCVDFMAEPM
jgi:hypothetical protein